MLNTIFFVLSFLCIISAIICEIIRKYAAPKFKLKLLDNATFVQFVSLLGFIIFAALSCITAKDSTITW